MDIVKIKLKRRDSVFATVTLIIVLSLFLGGCSTNDPKTDYVDIQKNLDASEQTITQTSDFEIKMTACDNAIGALKTYLVKHPNGEWPLIARNSLAAWETKKASFQQEYSGLLDQLAIQLKQKAINQSLEVHPLSNIEDITSVNRTKTKEGSIIVFVDEYLVRMRGSILGTSIFKLKVQVSGQLNMDTKTIFVNENADVEE